MAAAGTSVLDSKMAAGPGRIGILAFGVALLIGLFYVATHLLSDLSGVHATSWLPYGLLGVALLTALAFEFVNGFHDTANAVATVIYTHTMEPHIAVVWSGAWNFLGVLASSGAADWFGLPVSTTHVLSSGVAGTMAANHSGLQMSTVRNLALAWVLTLPASICLAAMLFWLFSKVGN
ncbi:MAG: inorganic phosphate transporter [Candidatus Acidiferrales bacterium]